MLGSLLFGVTDRRVNFLETFVYRGSWDHTNDKKDF